MGEDVDPVGQTSHRLTVTVTDPISVPPGAVEVAREMHVRFELHSPTIDRIALEHLTPEIANDANTSKT
jgi:hypothetical protein